MKYTNEKSNEKSNLVVSETETEDTTIPTSSSDTQENSTTKNTITQDDAVASGTSSIPLPAILDTNSCEVRSQNKYPLRAKSPENKISSKNIRLMKLTNSNKALEAKQKD